MQCGAPAPILSKRCLEVLSRLNFPARGASCTHSATVKIHIVGGKPSTTARTRARSRVTTLPFGWPIKRIRVLPFQHPFLVSFQVELKFRTWRRLNRALFQWQDWLGKECSSRKSNITHKWRIAYQHSLPAIHILAIPAIHILVLVTGQPLLHWATSAHGLFGCLLLIPGALKRAQGSVGTHTSIRSTAINPVA